MENLNLEIKPTGDITVREGKALDLKEPRVIKIDGHIDSPLRWIIKRKADVIQSTSHLVVNREKMSLELKIYDRNYYQDTITGKLEFHPVFLKFGINSTNYRTAFEMAELIKMNRSYFENHSVAAELVSALKNLKAKVDKEIEKKDNNRGDIKILIDQTVKSNVPERFNIITPIFKGQKKETIEVEVYFRPDDLTCTLVSPQANDIITQVTDSIIDEQITKIEDEYPSLVIIEV